MSKNVLTRIFLASAFASVVAPTTSWTTEPPKSAASNTDNTMQREPRPRPEIMDVGCSVSCNNASSVPNVSCSASGPKSTCSKDGQNLTCTDGTNTTTCNCSLGTCSTK